MIVIVDYGMGNLHSVAKALERVYDGEILISGKTEDVRKADKIILPGVGAFGVGMANLKKKGLVPVLVEEVIVKKKPFLGICLGMQLIATDSEEKGFAKGFGWVDAHVRRFKVDAELDLKIPHVGWNTIQINDACELLKGYLGDRCFYFVHSYHVECSSEKHIAARCNYGFDFVAAIHKDNIFATQFHPEKSQKNGLRLLKNFVGWCPEC
ncbi:imidazole glycerol phosphate synthase subunit HisH [Nanoarchaeota archaeon]